MTNPTPTRFTNVLDGLTWDATAEVFPLMCPMTCTNCHSLCVCYKEWRTHTTDVGTKEDVAFRTDGYTRGRCAHYDLTIGADRD